MIVAGIGCRRGESTTAVLAAIDATLAQHHRARKDISALATGVIKRNETGIIVAAGTLGVPLLFIGADALEEVRPRLLTASEPSTRATGSPSLSEAAALAAVGTEGQLLGPRVVTGHVTCALATRKASA